MADPLTHSHDTATPALSVETVPSEEFVRKLLETARDYISDAAAGTLTYEDSGEGFKAMAAEDLVRLDAALSASHLAKEGGEAVVVPYDDFHAAYQFVPRSKMSPDHCLKTRLRSLLRGEDLAHADEAEALAAAPAPNPSPAAKGGEARLLFYIRDEGPNRFYLTWAEAIADAEEQIAVCRRDARQDGEWSWSAEEIAIYACDAETEEPEEDGILLAQSRAILGGVDDDGREHFDYAMKLALATPSLQPADAVREALEAVLAEVDEAERTNTRNARTDWRAREFFVKHGRALRAALASDPAPAGETLELWHCVHKGGDKDFWTSEDKTAEACAASGRYDVSRKTLHPAPEDAARLREDLERVTRELEEEAALRVGAIDRMKAAERERDDAWKVLETANGLIFDARGAWWYARNEAKGGHLSRIWDRLVASDDAARSASREGASDE